jgi:stringent starvation protein B
VRNGEIVLNIGPVAASRLKMGNDVIECTVRFSGAAKELVIPVAAVAAIRARENGQGISFELEKREAVPEAGADEPGAPADTSDSPKSGGKPTLKRVK